MCMLWSVVGVVVKNLGFVGGACVEWCGLYN